MKSDGAALTFLRMTARNLYRRPVRTSLTVIAVAMGVIAIVSFATIAEGLWESVDASIHFNDSDLIVFQAGVAADILSTLDENQTREKLSAIPGIRWMLPLLWHVLPVADRPFFLMLGLQREDMDYGPEGLLRGRYPESDDEVLLGSIAQRVLDKDVDDALAIFGETYRVVGVFQSNVVFINGAVVLSLPRLQRLADKAGRVTTFQVGIEPGVDSAEVAAEIEREHPDLVAIADVHEYHKVDQGLEIIDEMVWVVSFIAIVIGSIIVANTMWMSVLERTREIGVLRAVGWSRPRIVSMILLEAVGVGLIACVVGCAGGAGLAKLSTLMPGANQFLEPVFGLTPFVLALVVAVVLSALGALIPAWRAAHISPAEALRYE